MAHGPVGRAIQALHDKLAAQIDAVDCDLRARIGDDTDAERADIALRQQQSDAAFTRAMRALNKSEI